MTEETHMDDQPAPLKDAQPTVNGETEKSKAKEPGSELWLNDVCIVCQSSHLTSEEKKEHSMTESHTKRIRVYDFFSKESSLLVPVKTNSILLDRYRRSRTAAVGLECIHEMIMPFSESRWWACSICYCAGANLEEVDDHIHTVSHIKTYIDEFHPARALSGDEERVSLMEKLQAVKMEILKDQGVLESPEVLQLNGITRAWAVDKLAVEDVEATTYASGEVFGGNYALHCKICHECVICDESSRVRSWRTHTTSNYHQRMQLVTSIIKQYEPYEIDSPFSGVITMNVWKENEDGVVTGPMTGMEFLLYFGSFPYCRLCFAALDSDRVVEHFCSSNHILKFLSLKLPGEMYMAMYLPNEDRLNEMQRMLEQLSVVRLGGPIRKVEVPFIPELISQNLNDNVLNVPTLMPPLLTLGFDQHCYWCPVCWRVIKVSNKEDIQVALWKEHCTRSKRHFEMATRRSLYVFDEENFAEVFSNLKFSREKSSAVWSKVTVNGVEIEVQKQADVGLDWIVEDLDANEVVCTACAVIFSRSNEEEISVHVRSMEHLMQYLHTTNREMFGLVKAQKSQEAERDLLMDYLQRSLPSCGNSVRVYSPGMSSFISGWGGVPYRKIELCAIAPEMRSVYLTVVEMVDKVADDGVENMSLPMKDALRMCSVKVCSLEGTSVLLWCSLCDQAFSVRDDRLVTGIWDEHLMTETHSKRAASLAENKFDAGGFVDERPILAVTVFDQADSKRRVTWRWNDTNRVFEYIYSMVGLADVIERRSLAVQQRHRADMFCRLCAEAIPMAQDKLDTHIRSFEHVVNFVHKYYRGSVRGLENHLRQSQKDGGKAVRRFLGVTLKNEFGKVESMRVYDPEGVRHRKEIEAQKLAAKLEIQRVKEEALRQAERRKKFEEERRKLAELELQRRKKKIEENFREMEAIMQLKRQEKEKEMERKKKEAEKKRAEIEKRRDELEKQMAEDLKQREIERERREKLAREQEAKRRARILSMERQRKRQEEEKKLREEAAKKKREEEEEKRKHEQMVALQLAELERQKAEEKASELRMAADRERARILQLQAEQRIIQDQQRIEQEMMRLEKQKPSLKMAAQNTDAQRSYAPLPIVYPGRSSSDGKEASRGEDGRRTSSFTAVPPPRAQTPKPSRSQTPKPLGSQAPTAYRPQTPKPLRDVSPTPPCPSKSALLAKRFESFMPSLKVIETREMLIDYMWKQGSEAIPEPELPEVFNTVAARRTGLLGLSSVYEVSCYDRPRFETMYCSMCSVWTTISDMFNHLATPAHRINYLFRNYKMYHKSAMSQPNETVRAEMLEQFAQQIWKLEGSGEVRYRLRCVIDYGTVMRLWPDHTKFMSNDWMEMREQRTARVATPPPGIDADGSGLMRNRMSSSRGVELPTKPTAGPTKVLPPRLSEYERLLNDFENSKDVPKLGSAKLTTNDKGSELKAVGKLLKPATVSDLARSSANAAAREKAPVRSAQSSTSKEKISLDAKKKEIPGSKSTTSRDSKGKVISKRESSRDRDRRHRSRSRSHRRSRSRSRHRTSRRSPSVGRGGASRRAVSRARSVRRSRSRSRSRRPTNGGILNTIRDIHARPDSTWNEAAAAFLAKIGDRKAAERVRGRTPSRRRTPSRSPPSKRARSPPRHLSSTEMGHQLQQPLYQGPLQPPGEEVREPLESRLQTEMSMGMMNVWPGMPAEVTNQIAASDNRGRIESAVNELFSKRSKMEEQQRPRDPKEDMRKLLGVLITMQQEVEQRGHMDESMVGRLYKEMGVASGNVASSNTLLQELCRMLVTDSNSFASNAPPPFQGLGGSSQVSVDLERFGIAPPKEPSPGPLGCVYQGAPEPEPEPARGNFQQQQPSPYTGCGGVGRPNPNDSLAPLGIHGGEPHPIGSGAVNPWLSGQPPKASVSGPSFGALPPAIGAALSGISMATLSSLSAGGVKPTGTNQNSRETEQLEKLAAKGDVYAARRLKETEGGSEETADLQWKRKAEESSHSNGGGGGSGTFWGPSGGSAPQADSEQQRPISRSAPTPRFGGAPIWPTHFEMDQRSLQPQQQQSSLSAGRTVSVGGRGNTEYGGRGGGRGDQSDDDILIVDESAMEEGRKAEAEKPKFVDRAKRIVEKHPALSMWTGANNRANNTTAKSTFSGHLGLGMSGDTSATSSTAPNTTEPSASMNPWTTWDRQAAARTQQVIDNSPVMPIPANQVPLPRSKPPSTDRPSAAAAKAMAAKIAAEEERYASGARLTRSQRRARARRLQEQMRMSNEAELAAEEMLQSSVEPIDDRAREMGRRDDWSTAGDSVASSKQRSFGRPPSASATSWEDLGSTVSAMLSSSSMKARMAKDSGAGRMGNTSSSGNYYGPSSSYAMDENGSTSGSPSKMPPKSLMELDVPPPPPPPLPSAAATTAVSTTETDIADVPVTQYSGQPTTYERPVTSSMYNPMAPNYGLPNTMRPLSSSSFGGGISGGSSYNVYDYSSSYSTFSGYSQY